MKTETLILLGVVLYLLTRRNTAGDVQCLDPTGKSYVIPMGPCPDYSVQSPNPAALVTCYDENRNTYQIPMGPCPDWAGMTIPPAGIPNYIPPGL